MEARIGGQREQPGILLTPDALAERIDPLVVVLPELERLPILNDAQAIEAPVRALKVSRAEKIVRTVGRNEDRLGVSRHLALEILEIDHADQIAADGGGREQRRREFDIEPVAPAHRHLELRTRRTRLVECRRNLARSHPPAHDGTGGEERGPGLAAEAFDIEGRSWGRDPG